MDTAHRLTARGPAAALAIGLVALAAACGGASPAGDTSRSGTSSGGASSSGTTSSSGASSSGTTSSSGASSGSTPECAGTSFTGERQPLDIYIMLDRSGSMADDTGDRSTTKWQAITAALSSFVGQPLDGTQVGLQYFGLSAPACSSSTRCSRNADCGYCAGRCFLGGCLSLSAGESSCSAADYAKPEVEIGPLAQTAPAIRTSIAAQEPSTDTPTSAALQGAIEHVRAWGAAPGRAGHALIALLATDGEPTACETNLGRIDGIAADGLSGSPSVRTFVIGVGGSLSNLNGIAKAGGTDAAYLVDTGANVTDQFLKALNDIRGKTVGCSYAIPSPPAGQQLDYGLVNVKYQPGGSGAEVKLEKVAGAAGCGTGATRWHYDSDAAPTTIVLCPATCAAVEADAAAHVGIVLGCRTNGEW